MSPRTSGTCSSWSSNSAPSSAVVRGQFFGKLNPFSSEEGRRSSAAPPGTLWAKIVLVACVPAAAIGIPIERLDGGATSGAPYRRSRPTLIVYGIAFIAIETVARQRTRAARELAARGPRGGRHFAEPEPPEGAAARLPSRTPRRASQTRRRHRRGRPPSASASSRCSRSCPAPRAPAPRSSAASCSAARRDGGRRGVHVLPRHPRDVRSERCCSLVKYSPFRQRVLRHRVRRSSALGCVVAFAVSIAGRSASSWASCAGTTSSPSAGIVSCLARLVIAWFALVG